MTLWVLVVPEGKAVRPSVGIYTCSDCDKPIEVRGDQRCLDPEHLLSGNPAVEQSYIPEAECERRVAQARDGLLEALRGLPTHEPYDIVFVADFLERRFSEEGA